MTVFGWGQPTLRLFTGRTVRLCYLWLPHGLLAVSTLFSLLTEQSPEHRSHTLLLAGIALVWLLGTLTLPGESWRANPWAMTGYVAGLLVIAALLTLHDSTFTLFALAGFFHPFLIPNPVLAVLGIAGTSVILNAMQGGWHDPFTAEQFPVFATIFLIQVFTISYSSLSGLRTVARSEQRRRTVLRLEAALQENAELHDRLLSQAREAGVAEERGRLAREIHDTLAQGLTGIITQLQAAKGARRQPAEWERHLDTAAELARESLSEARRSVQAMRPDALESDRLEVALSDVATRWSAINGIPAEVVTTGTARPMHPEVEVTLLRATQEALANVAKHARASRVGLTLSYMEDLVRLDVRDDGIGFVPAHPASSTVDGGFGLVAMRERIGALSGRLEIESEPGHGTAVSASVPAISRGGAR